MRSIVAALVVSLGLSAGSSAQNTCTTNLCLQQVSCPNGGTTSVSGVVYAPNGIDPLPNVTVYVPNAPVPAFTPGVSCPVVGTPPPGSPLVGATTAVDGTFQIDNMPAGTNIPLVIQSGRWRRQLTIPTVTACTDTPLPSTPVLAGQTPTAFAVFPSNQSQGDIPKFAVATGDADSVECVLRKVGIADSEFTDPSGNSSGYVGRVNFFLGTVNAGATIDRATPSEISLMSNIATLSNYDVLMLPCEGQAYARTSTELGNLASFANIGGRVYASHFAYSWMDTPQTFNSVAKWTGASANSINSGTAMVNPKFSGATTLSTWLTDVGASTTPGQIPISTIRTTQTGVNPPTEAWLTLISAALGNPTMQFVWDTPVTTTSNQCGRVLFNEYHVENPPGNPNGMIFPAECPSLATPLTPQEKLLEYSLFELTNNGGAFTLTPTTQSFGTAAVGFNSAVQSFTFTNNSTFATVVKLPTGSPDFNVIGNTCATVPGYGTCLITMVFSPSIIGAETGTLTVSASGTTLTSSLTGTGVPALTLSPTSLSFGSLDVGGSVSQTLTLSNTALGPLPVPAMAVVGPYTVSTAACGSSVAANSSCSVTVTFKPTSTGSLPGTVTAQSAGVGTPVTLSGNGIDFTIADAPVSGTVVAGLPQATAVTTTPLAGFANPLTLTCTTNAPASTCTLSSTTFTPASPATMTQVAITTTSQYTVVGFGAIGGTGWLSLLGVVTGLLLLVRRRSVGPRFRSALTLMVLVIVLGAASVGLSGCSGKQPAKNAVYTPADAYTYTISATDGFLVHNTTYSLTVTSH